MRRIVLLVTVALVMVAMMVVMAGVASAQPIVFEQTPCDNHTAGKTFGSLLVPPTGFMYVQAELRVGRLGRLSRSKRASVTGRSLVWGSGPSLAFIHPTSRKETLGGSSPKSILRGYKKWATWQMRTLPPIFILFLKT